MKTPEGFAGLTLGARLIGAGRCRFRVWAPRADGVEVRIVEPGERVLSMERDSEGYHEVIADDVHPGALYTYRLDGGDGLPDPASRFQPRGVHGPSAVVDPDFAWQADGFPGVSLRRCVFYEIHVGAFTRAGTFDAAIEDLDRLASLGVTMVELMPVSAFPGERNWGYDGVAPFAVLESYGGPDGMRRFVDACHARGMGVCLDVVYNHLGPEGNYHGRFGPYFTDRYKTPWGAAINFDGHASDHVRRYFIENALHWVTDYRVDALRLDAVHAICDPTASPFLLELTRAVHRCAARLNRFVHVIAESELNDPRLVRPEEAGGFGMDSHWSDDLHHALHVTLTGEENGYYADYRPLRDLARALDRGYVLDGRYSPFRGRRHGAPAADLPGVRFVWCAQNHDQVGNRMHGDRLSTLVDFERFKLAAAAVICSPGLPLLFMGEEYGETAPFLYFVHHGDPELVEAVRKGRREEFGAFRWHGEPPDPQDEETFSRSRLDRGLREQGRNRALESYYRALLQLRRRLDEHGLLEFSGQRVRLDEETGLIVVQRTAEYGAALLAWNFGDAAAEARPDEEAHGARLAMDSADARWAGTGQGPGHGTDARLGPVLTVPGRSFRAYVRADQTEKDR